MEIVNALMPFIKALLIAIIGFTALEFLIVLVIVILWAVIVVKAIKEEVY